MISIIAGAPSRAIPSKLREISAGHAAPKAALVLLSAIFLVVAVGVADAGAIAAVVTAAEDERERKRKIQRAFSFKGDAFGHRGFCCHSPPSPPLTTKEDMAPLRLEIRICWM